MSDTNYKTKLAEWKAKYGLDPTLNHNQDEIVMAAEEKASKKDSWCFGCDKQMPISAMKLITRRIDPYLQIDESEGDYIAKDNRVRMCPECFEKRYRT